MKVFHWWIVLFFSISYIYSDATRITDVNSLMVIANQWYSDLRKTKIQVKNILKPILNLFNSTLESMKLLKELLLLKGWFLRFRLWCCGKVQTWQGWLENDTGKKARDWEIVNGISLLVHCYVGQAKNHFLTSLALLKRSCGWAVCLEW